MDKRPLQTLMKKSKKYNERLNKTIKNKKTLKKCNNFCIKDYMVEMNKVYKNTSEKYNIPYKPPTKQEEEFAYTTCKKTFCNETCEGYNLDKKKLQQFKKKNKKWVSRYIFSR